MSARDLITGPVRATVKRHKAEAHQMDRDAELSEELVSEDDWHPKYRPVLFTASCGCVAKLIEDTDGDTAWKTWRWDEDECSVVGGDE